MKQSIDPTLSSDLKLREDAIALLDGIRDDDECLAVDVALLKMAFERLVAMLPRP